jgi:hypothetical protein
VVGERNLSVEHWRNDADSWEPMSLEKKLIRSVNLSIKNFTGLLRIERGPPWLEAEDLLQHRNAVNPADSIFIIIIIIIIH